MRRRRWAWLAPVALGAALILASCGNAAVSLSLRPGTVSVCYRGLPTARAALHEGTAALRSVHRISFEHLERSMPDVTLSSGTRDMEVCAFTFDGHFAPGQVTGAPLDAHGRVAVVVVSSTKLELVASYVGPALRGGFPEGSVAPLTP